jgi:hypothetical protein
MKKINIVVGERKRLYRSTGEKHCFQVLGRAERRILKKGRQQ